MLRTLLVLNCLMLCTLASAQQLTVSDYATTGSTMAIRFYNLAPMPSNLISGSPYLNESFQKGKVKLSSGKWIEHEALRYNTFTHQLEYQSSGRVMTTSPRDVVEFVIGDVSMKNGFEVIDKQDQLAYYQVLLEGKRSVLKYVVSVLEAVKGFDDVKQGDKLVTNAYYYLMDDQQHIQKFFLSKKSFLTALGPIDAPKAEKVIDQKNLKIKSIDDVLEVLKVLGDS